MPVIHGGSHAAIRFMRQAPASLAVYWLYLAHANDEGVAWPTLRGLRTETGWSINECHDGRRWLVEHGALEAVTGYIRPQWRELPAQQRARRINLDQSEYYRTTGVLVVKGKTYPMLFEALPQLSHVTPDETWEQSTDVTPDETSTGAPAGSHVTPGESWEPAPMTHRVAHRTVSDMQPGVTELDSSTTELDSSSTQLGLKSSSLEPPRESETAVVDDSDRPNVFTWYENAFGPLTPALADTLRDAANEWPAQWLKDAFKEAVEHNGRSWAYVRTILETCREEGRPPGSPPAGVARASTNGRGRSAVAPSTPTPTDELVSRLAAEEFAQLSEVPPPDYLAGKPEADRLSSWKLVGRKGTAKQRAEARLARQEA